MMNLPFGLPPDHDRVAFDRAELGIILSVYGRMVAAGEWRDYAMSFLRDAAVFSVRNLRCQRALTMHAATQCC